MLEFKTVSFQYYEDNIAMMKDLSFDVEEGEFVAIIGASGCGKSTIFRLINGLERPDSGEILVDGIPIESIKNYSAFMPQKDLLFPWRTIEKNLALPMEIMKVSKTKQEEQINKVLKEIGLEKYKKRFPKELSGGMKQRIAFGRTLLAGASMLLLDEPFSALDYLTRVEMQEWLASQWNDTKCQNTPCQDTPCQDTPCQDTPCQDTPCQDTKLKKPEKTILFITHDVEEALFLAKTIYIIHNERPFTSMEKISVPLSYPRKREDLKKLEIIELKEQLIGKLRQGVIL